MATRKSILQDTGLLDDRFEPAGWEDNDICLRLQEAGYELMIAGDTFIYHYGGRTISDSWKKPHRTFIEKWQLENNEKKTKKLIVSFRVRITDQEKNPGKISNER